MVPALSQISSPTILFFPRDLQDHSWHSNNDWHDHHFHVSQILQFSGNIIIIIYLLTDISKQSYLIAFTGD